MSEKLREGIRADGTVEGYVVETHHLPLESASIDEGGFFRIVGDGGPINYEIRVPVGPVRSALDAIGGKAPPVGDWTELIRLIMAGYVKEAGTTAEAMAARAVEDES